MVCALTVRQLKPGTFEEFREKFMEGIEDMPEGSVRFKPAPGDVLVRARVGRVRGWLVRYEARERARCPSRCRGGPEAMRHRTTGRGRRAPGSYR